jgi:hypothetical protein
MAPPACACSSQARHAMRAKKTAESAMSGIKATTTMVDDCMRLPAPEARDRDRGLPHHGRSSATSSAARGRDVALAFPDNAATSPRSA